MFCHGVPRVWIALRLPPCRNAATERRGDKLLCCVCDTMLWRSKTDKYASTEEIGNDCAGSILDTMWYVRPGNKELFAEFYESLLGGAQTPETAKWAARVCSAWLGVVDRGCVQRLLTLRDEDVRGALFEATFYADRWPAGKAHFDAAVNDPRVRARLGGEEVSCIVEDPYVHDLIVSDAD